MNNIVLIGRITKDPELKYTNNGKGNTRFTLAVQRNKDETDFVNCVAWEKTAENIAEYFKKGSQIAVQGAIRTGNYEKDGRTVYTIDVWIYKFDFIGNNQNVKKNNENEDNEHFPF